MKPVLLSQFKRKVSQGFTLLEVLIAIAILSFAITATFTAAQSGLSSAIESKNQVVSFYLAQEAVEFVRNMRDTNALCIGAGSTSGSCSGVTNWLSGYADINAPCDPRGSCSVDIVANKLTACPQGTGTCSALVQDANTQNSTYGMYGDAYNSHPSSWTETRFKREIRITLINQNEISVVVSVTAVKGSYEQTFTVQENIFNWQS